MKEVNVAVSVLLERLKENRGKHVIEFRDAILGWQTRAVEELDGMAKELSSEDYSAAETLDSDVFPSLWVTAAADRPQCHVKDYDRAIGMLEMSHDTVVKISSQEYSQFIDDEWTWSREFTVSNSKYLGR